MEFFIKTKAVKLRSHLNKYLVADEDQTTVHQSRNGAARKSRWLVELVDTNAHVVRLKSCYNRYLTASGEPSLLCMTGRKVVQTLPENDHAKDLSIEWQPIRDGFQVKLKTFGGSYLRANGGTPPWRNSVTHDCPHAADWVVWDVEAVDVPEDEAVIDYWSMVWSFSSVSEDIFGLDFGPASTPSSFSGSPSPSPSPRWLSLRKVQSPFISFSRTTAMDIFQTAKAVCLKSAHGKYLIAEDNEETVTQDRNGFSKAAKWTVEFVENSDTIIRLKSCYGKYLTASAQPFLLGLTGRKVVQTQPSRVDSSVEWEPIRESGGVKLKTRYGQYLRANWGLPPWRNSVTHDIPQHMATRYWILWEVHVMELLDEEEEEEEDDQSPEENAVATPPPMLALDCVAYESSSPTTSHHSSISASLSGQESHEYSLVTSSPKVSEGRLIYFQIANEFGEVEERFDELCITFKGSEVNELTERLETELGLEALTVCSRSPLNGKLCPLRLHLPPNNATMHVILLPTSSTPQRHHFRRSSADITRE